MVDRKFAQLGIAEHHVMRSGTVNGLRISYAPGRVETQNGALDVDVIIYGMPEGRRMFSLVTYAPAGAGLGPFRAMVESVRPMAQNEGSATRSQRVKIMSVAAGDTVATLASRMAMTDGAMEAFLLINDLKAHSVLQPGMSVKLVQQ